MPSSNLTHDVAIVGGGAAGLSAAVALARSLRRVVVIDAGEPRNAPATAVHGFLAHEGVSPNALLERGRGEVTGYGGQVWKGRAAAASRDGDSFVVRLDDGRQVAARRLLVTTGLLDELPNVPGVRERWGHDVLHCPYCHGWEVRDRAVAVLASGPMSVHQAQLFRQLTPHVTLFAGPSTALGDEQIEQLAARGIALVREEVQRLVVENDRLSGVQLASGRLVPCDAVVVAPRFVGRTELLSMLGLETTEHPMGIGAYVAADPMGRTGVTGVWVAGNVTDVSANVAGAVAQGARAAADINADLVAEDTARAVAASRLVAA
jgi:thioredoxin reductase